MVVDLCYLVFYLFLNCCLLTISTVAPLSVVRGMISWTYSRLEVIVFDMIGINLETTKTSNEIQTHVHTSCLFC